MSKSAVRPRCCPRVAALSSFLEALGAAPILAHPTAQEIVSLDSCSVLLNLRIEQCVSRAWLQHRSYLRHAVKEILSQPAESYTYGYLFSLLERLYFRLGEPLAVMSHRLLNGMNTYFGQNVMASEALQSDPTEETPSLRTGIRKLNRREAAVLV